MIRYFAWCVVAVWFGITVIHATPSEWDVVRKAIEHSGNKTGITLLHRVLQEDPANGVILYDIGTLYLNDNQLGEAVWYLERARQVAPHHRLVHRNLVAAKAGVVGDVSHTQVWDGIVDGLRWVSIEEMTTIWLVMTVMLGLLSLGWTGGKLSRNHLIIGVVVWMMSTVPFAIRYWDGAQHRAVVVRYSALRIGPDITSTSVVKLAPGFVVTIEDTDHDWAKIALASGTIGWVQRHDVRSL